MKIKFNVKHNTIAVYCIIVFVVCLLFTAVVFKFSTVRSYLDSIIGILAPVIWGVVIAYLLNPIVKLTEKYLNKFAFKKKKHPKISRTMGIIVAMIFLIGISAAVIGTIVPEIIETLKGLFTNISSYLNNLQDYLNDKILKLVKDHPQIEESLNTEFKNIQDVIISAVNQYQPKIDNLLGENGIIANLTVSAKNIIVGIKNCALGIIVSVYLLYSRDTMVAQAKKIVYASFNERTRRHILSVATKANTMFSRFISGKAIDSFIIGVLCFIGMMVLNMKSYAVIVSVVVGITNMIPFFGPIIGAVPSAVLILLTTPSKTLVFIIFILLLQQLDGSVIGPKILGDSLGLSPFWVMFSIFIGGGLFGFIGLFAAVPLFAVIYTIFAEIIASKLEKKKLPVDTVYYQTNEEVLQENPEKTKAEPPNDKNNIENKE